MCVLRLVLVLVAAILSASLASPAPHPAWTIDKPTGDEHSELAHAKRATREAQFDSSPDIEDRYGPWSGRQFGPNRFQNPWNAGGSRRNKIRNPTNFESGSIFFRDDDDFDRPNIIPPPNVRATTPSTTTVAVPGMETTRSACEDTCQITSQYNPVCGSDTLTYTNMAWLTCAQNCGKAVRLLYYGSCTRIPPN